MSYEFQSVLHDTIGQAHDAMAGEWLSAGGNNDRDDIMAALSDYSDQELAVEAEEGWALTEIDYYDHDELVMAFATIRENPAEAFSWDD